jgi:hypothetical protein
MVVRCSHGLAAAERRSISEFSLSTVARWPNGYGLGATIAVWDGVGEGEGGYAGEGMAY